MLTLFRFRIFGTDIAVKFSFLFFNAVLFLIYSRNFALSFWTVCISHELGHIFALKLTGGSVNRVELSGFGIKITATPSVFVSDSVFVLMSGPTVNIIMALVLSAIFGSPHNTTALLSLWEGIFNLLPYSFLDGGAVLGVIFGKDNRILRAFRIILTFVIVFLVILYNYNALRF